MFSRSLIAFPPAFRTSGARLVLVPAFAYPQTAQSIGPWVVRLTRFCRAVVLDRLPLIDPPAASADADQANAAATIASNTAIRTSADPRGPLATATPSSRNPRP